MDDVDALVTNIGSFNPDIIVPSMRSGLIPAGITSEKLCIKDVRPINIERIGEERKIVYDLQGDISGKNVLLLEDDLPTGKGFLLVKKIFEGRGANVKVAVVYVNSLSEKVADFFGKKHNPLPDLPWKPTRSGDRVLK